MLSTTAWRALGVTCALIVSCAAAYADGFYSVEDVAGGTAVMFRQPSISGSTSAFMDTSVNPVPVASTEEANSGAKSIKTRWQWKAAATNPWLRLTTNSTAIAHRNPIITYRDNPLTPKMLRFRYKLTEAPGGGVLCAIGVRDVAGVTGNDLDASSFNSGGAIEIVGASGLRSGGAPITTHMMTVSPNWQKMEFLFGGPNADPIRTLAGTPGGNILDNDRGTLDSLALAPLNNDNTLTGPYTLYLDDFEIVTVPEPATIATLACGLAGLIRLRRRK